jgi:hypothetical protein
MHATDAPVTIGALVSVIATPTRVAFFDGKIDDVRIFPRVLTAVEIAHLHNYIGDK